MRNDDGSDLFIRTANEDDGDALLDLWHVAGLTGGPRDPAEDLKEFRAAKNGAILVGTSNGRLAASVYVGHDGYLGWLHSLAVHPNDHRRGFGRQILRAAELWLSERGIRKANAAIDVKNAEATRFFQALGYVNDRVRVMGHWLQRPPLPDDSHTHPDSEGKLHFTITYLEMTDPPGDPPPHPPPGQKVALMRAERPTVRFYRFLYETIGEAWLWWERRALDDRALARLLNDERVEVYVLYVDGVPAGYAELDRRGAPDVDLAYFGLMPEYIGRGFGRYLLGAAIDLAWHQGARRLTVNTNTLDHPKALTLYQRMGFRPVRQETQTIDDPRLTGLIPLV